MDDFLRATQSAVLGNEAKTLATKMGMAHVSLLQRANPDNDSHNLTIQHLFGILLHSGDMRPLEALADAFGFDLAGREVVAAKSLNEATLCVSAKFADVTKAATEALADERVTRSRKEQVEHAVSEAKLSLVVLLESVRAAQ